MAVKIRLKRIGAKKHPCYRIVVADARYPRDGRFIEQIGTYDPMTKPEKVEVDGVRALKWIKNGAQPTETVRSILKKTRALEKAVEQLEQAAHEAQAAQAAQAELPGGEAQAGLEPTAAPMEAGAQPTLSIIDSGMGNVEKPGGQEAAPEGIA